MNGESRIEADLACIVAQEPRADPMEGPGPKRIGHDTGVVADHPARDPLDPPRHLGGGPRREKVISRILRGSAPLTIKWATRCARVLVLPDPAPAMTSSGAPGAASFSRTPCSTARRCSGLSFSR